MFKGVLGIPLGQDDTLHDVSIPSRTARQAVLAKMSASCSEIEADCLHVVPDAAARSGSNQFADGPKSFSSGRPIPECTGLIWPPWSEFCSEHNGVMDRRVCATSGVCVGNPGDP